MSRNRAARLILVVVYATGSMSAPADEETPAKPAEEQVLLIDSFGHLVAVPASSIPKGLLPPAGVGLRRQAPQPAPGARQSAEVEQRLDAGRQPGFELFPGAQPKLASYLASLDELGNTALRPGPLFVLAPLETVVQQAKYRSSEAGFRYSLRQTMTYAGMSGATTGATSLGFYTLDLVAKWAVYGDRAAGSAGWISLQAGSKTGIGSAGFHQDARTSLETVTDPTGLWHFRNGFRVPELAWQQSFRHGEVVALAGMVSQGNYLDVNSYANSGRRQFLNSALINSW